jgi:LysM repeat protein
MRRDVLRFWGGVGLVVLLTLVLISGCTRPKSSGPPEPNGGEGTGAVTSQPSILPSSTPLSGDAAIEATTTALAATGTAEAQTAAATEAPATVTPTLTQAAEPTTPAATEEPKATQASDATGTPQATASPAATASSSSAGAKTHTVQAGENLFRIALKYGLTYQKLAAHNGIANPNFIMVGQVLKIPAEGDGDTTTPPAGGTRYHTVQVNENLFRISLKYNMLYTVLAQANDLSYPYTIYPGQRLVIP